MDTGKIKATVRASKDKKWLIVTIGEVNTFGYFPFSKFIFSENEIKAVLSGEAEYFTAYEVKTKPKEGAKE